MRCVSWYTHNWHDHTHTHTHAPTHIETAVNVALRQCNNWENRNTQHFVSDWLYTFIGCYQGRRPPAASRLELQWGVRLTGRDRGPSPLLGRTMGHARSGQFHAIWTYYDGVQLRHTSTTDRTRSEKLRRMFNPVYTPINSHSKRPSNSGVHT